MLLTWQHQDYNVTDMLTTIKLLMQANSVGVGTCIRDFLVKDFQIRILFGNFYTPGVNFTNFLLQSADAPVHNVWYKNAIQFH